METGKSQNSLKNCVRSVSAYSKGMNAFQRARGHLKTINTHRSKVMHLCFRCGLYKQGLAHDLSKYSPQELRTGFRYFQGNRSPIDKQKEVEGYSASWLHHKGRNRHHWEYWIDNGLHGVMAVKMPFNFVVEMFCDRVAACQVYQKVKYTDRSALDYYLFGRDKLLIHPETDRQILYLLAYLSHHGLDQTITLIRKLLKEYKATGNVTLPDAEKELSSL